MGVVLTLGEGEAEELGGDDGVVEEQLEEIAEAEEQQRVAREAALHLEILLHHGGHATSCPPTPRLPVPCLPPKPQWRSTHVQGFYECGPAGLAEAARGVYYSR